MPHTTDAVKKRLNLDSYGYPLPLSVYRKLRKMARFNFMVALSKCTYPVMSLLGGLLWLARLGKHYPPLNPQSFHPRRILVIRIDFIGDLVLTLPVVRALKRTYPQAEIDLLATPSSAKVALHDPHLAEIITYDPAHVWHPFKWDNWHEAYALWHRLRARRYDLAVNVYGHLAATLAVLSGATRRLGYKDEAYPGFMTDTLPGGMYARSQHWSPLDNKHEVDSCLQLAQAAGATITPDDRIPYVAVDAQSQREIEQILQEAGVQADKPLIACHVSSVGGYSKRWPPSYWATLLDRLIREADAQTILTGAPTDLPIIEDVIGRMRERPINLAGKTSLLQFAALLQRTDLLISGDSGPGHLATGLKVPILGLYGPTNPVLVGPLGPGVTILNNQIWCSPCYMLGGSLECRFHTKQCMKSITPTQVFIAVQSKLKRHSEVR